MGAFNRHLSYLCLILVILLETNGSSAETSETLLNQLYAVHATRILPSQGSLKAGLGGLDQLSIDAPFQLFPDFRCTLHFALGEMVRPVEDVISWEDCPYAVVVPLKTLIPQLINLNCYDTFILGDLKLGSDSILVAPQSCQALLPSRMSCQIHYFDSQQSTLRQAIDLVIAEKGGFAIRMNEEDREDELNEAIYEGENINTLEFFQPLKIEYPYLSIGTRFDSLDGKSYLFGQLETELFEIAAYFFQLAPSHFYDSIKALHFRRDAIDEEKQQLIHYVSSLPFSKEMVQLFYQKIEYVEIWINIIQAEIYVRQVYNKSLVGSKRPIWEALYSHRLNLERICLYLDTVWSELTPYSDRQLTFFSRCCQCSYLSGPLTMHPMMGI